MDPRQPSVHGWMLYFLELHFDHVLYSVLMGSNVNATAAIIPRFIATHFKLQNYNCMLGKPRDINGVFCSVLAHF